MKSFCAAAVHDTRNSTVPSDPFASRDACFRPLADSPFGGNKMQMAYSNATITLPVFLTLELLRTTCLPLMVVPSVQGVNRAPFRSIHPLGFLSTAHPQINDPQPC